MSIRTGTEKLERAQAPAGLETVDIGHENVENHNIGNRAADALQSLLAVRGLLHDVPFQLESTSKGAANRVFIIYNEYTWFDHSLCIGHCHRSLRTT